MTYDEWEEKEGISPSSPESYYAERAWDAALSTFVNMPLDGAKLAAEELNNFSLVLAAVCATIDDSDKEGQRARRLAVARIQLLRKISKSLQNRIDAIEQV